MKCNKENIQFKNKTESEPSRGSWVIGRDVLSRNGESPCGALEVSLLKQAVS